MLSPNEQTRRYNGLRAAMRDAGADALVLNSRAAVGTRGLIRYVSDYQMPTRQAFAVFVEDADPIMVLQTPSHRWWAQRSSGLADVRARPEPIEEVGDILAGLPNPPELVLIAGMNTAMQVADYNYLRERFPRTRFDDGTAAVERVKVVKSAEEIELVREASRVADQGFKRFLEAVRTGRSEREVVADVEQTLGYQGTRETILLIATSPRAPYIYDPTDHVLQQGDVVNFGVECTGPSGYWVERGGTVSLGEPSEQMRKLFDDAVRILREGANLFRPGVVAGEAAAKIKDLIEDCGHKMAAWTGHVIGLDVTEGPRLLKAERRTLEEGMIVAYHPQIADQHGNGVYVGDVFLVTPEGGMGFTQIPFALRVL